MICEICGERSGCGDYHETCQCDNKICDNLSRSFEDRFCCIECADYHDNVIDLALEREKKKTYDFWNKNA